MKVIYNTCYADPWLQVAKKLKEEHGWEPVYWNGYEDDNSKELIPLSFPNCLYHAYYDAWKGVFPKEIEERYADSHIDVDFLREYASYELQAIKMMDRMDPDRYSFNFMERQRHYRKMLKYWTACIQLLKPDIVVSAVIPHRVYDYILYILCKYYNIKYISHTYTVFTGRVFSITNVSNIGDVFKPAYKELLNSNISAKQINLSLSKEIINAYEKTKQNYKIAEPEYMIKNDSQHLKSRSFFSLLNKFFEDMIIERNKYFNWKNGYLLNGIPSYYKNKSKCIEDSSFSLLGYSFNKLRTNGIKTRLRKYYLSITKDPNLNKSYIILPLHYQPEMTSNPSGDIFAEQLLCVEIMLKNLPNNYNIYVKEHRAQFYSHFEGHTSRIKEFYDDLAKYPRVRLISENYDQFELIKNAKAVATITGTVGWEAMALGKPVICFGLSWYESYNGVLKITDEKSASKLMDFINNFKFDERDLLCYLNAVQSKTVKAYFYRGLKEKMNMSEAECVGNLVRSVLEMSGGGGELSR